ncbi:MAG: NifB/NifX family molybdenum-iron cluster-binding protein [Promethearchaeota archaeon]
MKIAISTDSGKVSPHFGRAPEFTFITIEDNKVIKKDIFPNPGHTVGSIPKFINEQGAKCMITGGMGHRAIQFFNQYGIEVIMGVDGNLDDIIKKILNGTLEGGESICSPGGGKGYGVEKIHTEADNNHDHHHTHY